jgi:hypothetical protein
MRKVGPETSATCTWPVHPIYMIKILVHRFLIEPVHGLYSLYICDEKIWSRNLPYSMYMTCRAYIYDEKCWSRNFLQSLYLDCRAYIHGKKIVRQHATATAGTWPVQPIYMMKKGGPETSPKAYAWPVQPIYI